MGNAVFGPKKLLNPSPTPATLASAMRTLELDQHRNGQWKYRIVELTRDYRKTLVDWEWGTFQEKETIKQAEERFGSFDKVYVLDWI